MKKSVFITGASSGIGMSCAQMFAEAGFQIIAAARRKEKIIRLCEQLTDTYQVLCHPLELDVRDELAVSNALQSIPPDFRNITVLINNAGLAMGMNTIDEGSSEDWNIMIDTNIKGVLWVSQAIIPIMKENQNGHIINIGSIAGREVYPKGNVYCATKHAVDALTQAMRIDLLPYGIRVTQVAPGAAETEFSIVRFKGDAQQANTVYKGYTPLTPDDIAEVVLFCAQRPSHVNINDVLVMPTDQAAAGLFNKKI